MVKQQIEVRPEIEQRDSELQKARYTAYAQILKSEIERSKKEAGKGGNKE